MKSTLKILMNLANGKTTTITVPNPRADITKADIDAFVEAITSTKALIVAGYPAVGLKKAYLQNVDDQEIVA